MGLFSLLGGQRQHNADGIRGGSSEKGVASELGRLSKSLSLPTVLQLYTADAAPMVFWEGTTSSSSIAADASRRSFVHPHAAMTATATTTSTTTTASPPPPLYAHLTFQAVPTGTAATSATPAGSGGGKLLLASPTAPTTAAGLLLLPPPDLGVWNCCISAATTTTAVTAVPTNSSSIKTEDSTEATTTTTTSGTPALSDLLLKIPDSESIHAVCMTVDMTCLSKLEPSITLMQEALIRYLIDRPTRHNMRNSNATTTLFHLRQAQFGLAKQESATTTTTAASTLSASEDAAAERSVAITLQVCARLPSNAAAHGSAVAADGSHHQHDDYQQQQAYAVAVYHLRRFAAALQASLVFVVAGSANARNTATNNDEQVLSAATSRDESVVSGDGGTLQQHQQQLPFVLYQQQPALTTAQLAMVWKELALGREIWNERVAAEVLDFVRPFLLLHSNDDDADQEPSADDAPPPTTTTMSDSGYAWIYGPDHHYEELIESVLLRNAHFPGHWDAATDSIWKILPPSLPPQPRAAGIANRAWSASPVNSGGGDDTWLAELRDSILGGVNTDTSKAVGTPGGAGVSGTSMTAATTAGMSTPAATKKKDSAAAAAASSATKTPGDAGVSSFFENLLKNP